MTDKENKLSDEQYNGKCDIFDSIKYIDKYGGELYIGKEKREELDNNGKNKYNEMEEKSREARDVFKVFAEKIIDNSKEEYTCNVSNWCTATNPSKICDYLWAEFKKKEWSNYPNSISIFIEKTDKYGCVLSVKLEIDDKKVDNPYVYKKQSDLLLLHLPYSSNEYVIREVKKEKKAKVEYKSTNTKYIGNDREEALKIYKSIDIAKVQIVKRIIKSLNKDEKKVVEETKQAFNALLPAYESIINELDNDSTETILTAETTNGEKNMEDEKIALNTILYGPPGTGKTYQSLIYAVGICEGKAKTQIEDDIKECEKKEKYKKIIDEYREKYKDRINYITFHQAYGYEEFIEGIKPKINKNDERFGENNNRDAENKIEYHYKNGVFKEFCNKAKKDDKNNYVFIIDEINRGNISKIFGELITLIEETKRNGAEEAMEVELPYSNERFSVPNNVYIIGTMNTADRSIAQLDTALRRRFSFVEMIPNSDVLKDIIVKEGEKGKYILEKNEGGADKENISIKNILDGINKRIEVLFDREHTIGHAFFTSLLDGDQINQSKLMNIFKDKIIPLLQEYFYDDYEKIALVLGENIKKANEHNAIIYEEKYEEDIFDSDRKSELLEENHVYKISDKALDKFETYKKMAIGAKMNKLTED